MEEGKDFKVPSICLNNIILIIIQDIYMYTKRGTTTGASLRNIKQWKIIL